MGTGGLPSFLRRLMGESEQGAFRERRRLTSQTKCCLTLPKTNSTVYTSVEPYFPAGVISLLACTVCRGFGQGSFVVFLPNLPCSHDRTQPTCSTVHGPESMSHGPCPLTVASLWHFLTPLSPCLFCSSSSGSGLHAGCIWCQFLQKFSAFN